MATEIAGAWFALVLAFVAGILIVEGILNLWQQIIRHRNKGRQ